MDTTIRAEPFADPPEKGFIKTYHENLRRHINAVMAQPESERAQHLPELGKEFLEACMRGNPDTVKIFVALGMDVNYQDLRTGDTGLHSAAGTQARRAIKVLLKTDKCDHLLRDNKGRLASEVAYQFGRDPALARLLGNKERKQAEAQGIKLTRRPSP